MFELGYAAASPYRVYITNILMTFYEPNASIDAERQAAHPVAVEFFGCRTLRTLPERYLLFTVNTPMQAQPSGYAQRRDITHLFLVLGPHVVRCLPA